MAQTKNDYSSDIGYTNLDPFKILAQEKAAGLQNDDYYEEPTSRGESAFVAWEMGPMRPGIAKVIEGLGTKNIVAEKVYRLTEDPYGFSVIAKDTVAMIVNDLITVGALPSIIDMHFAVGDSLWMKDEKRAAALLEGWREGCKLSGALWGGGETPTLKGIINPEYPEISGSAVGTLKRKHYLRGALIKPDDAIIFLTSSGIHANGLTAARTVADILPEGYMTKLPSGMTYGEALLQPTHNYVSLMRALRAKDCDVHYAVNITGHGWRKLMRANTEDPYEYHIFDMPEVPEVFEIIKKTQNILHKDMYADFNMGAGFALYVPQNEVSTVMFAAKKSGYIAMIAGEVRHAKNKEKSVFVEPLNLRFESESLSIR